jgi:hypothetical protein
MALTADRESALRYLNEWFPCTAVLLDDRIDNVVDRFCREASAAPDPDGAADSQRWLACVRAELAGADSTPAYAGDVAAYESAIAALMSSDDATADTIWTAERNAVLRELPWSTPLRQLVPVVGRHVRVERYTFNVPAIVAAIEECDRLEGRDQPETCVVLLRKSRTEPRPLMHIVSDGVRLLLALCDGRRDCARVLQALRVEAGEQPEGFDERALDALEALRARDVLTYHEPDEATGQR